MTVDYSTYLKSLSADQLGEESKTILSSKLRAINNSALQEAEIRWDIYLKELRNRMKGSKK